MLTRLNLNMSATGKGTNRAPGAKHSKAARPPAPALLAETRDSKSRSWQSVRKKEVERAKRLVKDPNYPPATVTKAVARLLAKNLQKLDDPAAPVGI
jgi:hypothetical protein